MYFPQYEVIRVVGIDFYKRRARCRIEKFCDGPIWFFCQRGQSLTLPIDPSLKLIPNVFAIRISSVTFSVDIIELCMSNKEGLFDAL